MQLFAGVLKVKLQLFASYGRKTLQIPVPMSHYIVNVYAQHFHLGKQFGQSLLKEFLFASRFNALFCVAREVKTCASLRIDDVM
jgi:hypothetical protein